MRPQLLLSPRQPPSRLPPGRAPVVEAPAEVAPTPVVPDEAPAKRAPRPGPKQVAEPEPELEPEPVVVAEEPTEQVFNAPTTPAAPAARTAPRPGSPRPGNNPFAPSQGMGRRPAAQAGARARGRRRHSPTAAAGRPRRHASPQPGDDAEVAQHLRQRPSRRRRPGQEALLLAGAHPVVQARLPVAVVQGVEEQALPIAAALQVDSALRRQPVVVVQEARVAPAVVARPRVPSGVRVGPHAVVASPSVSVAKSSTTWKPPRLVACASARATARPFALRVERR